MGEAYEVDYWSRALGISKERLVAAVEKVGDRIEDIRRELGNAT